MKKGIFLVSLIVISLSGLRVKAQGASCALSSPVVPGTYVASTLIGEASQQPDADSAGWYSFTPATSGILNINSCGGGSDTRLWIWSGSCGSLQPVANNDDFAGCISSGTNAYASKIENVILLAGNTYYFEWDDIWSSAGFTWSFTFNALPENNDVEINFLTNRYTRIPITQAPNGISLGATLKNLSGNSITNVVLTAEIYELPNLTTPIATYASSPITMGIGSQQTVVSGVWSPSLTASKSYQIKYIKTQTEADQVSANDQSTQNLILDYNYMARDNNTYTTAFNWGNSNYSQGVQYSVLGPDQMTGVQYYIASSSTSQVYTVQVFPITNGTIGATALYTSSNITANGAGWKTHLFPAPLNVTTGDYLVAITKSGTTSFPVGCDASLFTTNSNFVKTGANPWYAMELYGVSYAFMIRPRFGSDPANDVVFVNNLNPGGEYTKIHTRQSLNGNALTFSANGRNVGTSLIQGVTLTATVKDAQGTVLYTATSAPQDLNSAQTSLFTVPSYTVNNLGNYTIDYIFESTTDQVPQNNGSTTGFSRTKQTMSRTYGITGSLGIGNNATAGVYDNGILGQTYTLTSDDILDSVQFVLNATTPANQPVRVDIYATANGVPTGTPIASTTTYTTTASDNTNGVVLKLPISTGSLALTAGTYFFGVIENAGNIRLATSTSYHTPNRAFIKWDQSPAGATAWATVEQFNFFVSYVINPIFKTCIPYTFSDSITAASCGANDGAINNTISGGTGALTYLWDSGQTTEDLDSLASGIYSIAITDLNMCSLTQNIVVPSLSNLSVSSFTNNITCPNGNNGQIILTAANGVEPYDYAWGNNIVANDTATSLTAGNYSCIITDATGCVVVVFDTLTEISGLNANVLNDIVVCTANSTSDLTVTAQGGVGNYNYQWLGTTVNQSTFSNATIGSYTCVVTDSLGCTDSVSTAIILTDLNASSSATDLLCNGSNSGSVTISVQGGIQPYIYDWDNSTNSTATLAGLSGGSYSCIITDAAGCSDSISATLNEPATIVITSNVTPEINGNDGAIDLTVSGGVSPYSYLWENNQTTEDLSNLSGGTYSFTVTDANGCVYSDSISVQSADLLDISNFTWNVYPNPVNEKINVEVPIEGAINIFDCNGRFVKTYSVEKGLNIIEMTQFEAGIYLIKMNNQVKRWIKE